MLPAFKILQQSHNHRWVTFVALGMVAILVAFYVSMTASALPALFPDGITVRRHGPDLQHRRLPVRGHDTAVADLLVNWTDNKFAPALYIMFFAAIALFALRAMPESAKRPLLGSGPTVASIEDAEELVATQDDNPYLDKSAMPMLLVAGRS